MSEPYYIVTKGALSSTVMDALRKEFTSTSIADTIHKRIMYNIETVLEDDCEEVTEEMWNAWTK